MSGSQGSHMSQPEADDIPKPSSGTTSGRSGNAPVNFTGSYSSDQSSSGMPSMGLSGPPPVPLFPIERSGVVRASGQLPTPQPGFSSIGGTPAGAPVDPTSSHGTYLYNSGDGSIPSMYSHDAGSLNAFCDPTSSRGSFEGGHAHGGVPASSSFQGSFTGSSAATGGLDTDYNLDYLAAIGDPGPGYNSLEDDWQDEDAAPPGFDRGSLEVGATLASASKARGKSWPWSCGRFTSLTPWHVANGYLANTQNKTFVTAPFSAASASASAFSVSPFSAAAASASASGAPVTTAPPQMWICDWCGKRDFAISRDFELHQLSKHGVESRDFMMQPSYVEKLNMKCLKDIYRAEALALNDIKRRIIMAEHLLRNNPNYDSSHRCDLNYWWDKNGDIETSPHALHRMEVYKADPARAPRPIWDKSPAK